MIRRKKITWLTYIFDIMYEKLLIELKIETTEKHF